MVEHAPPCGDDTTYEGTITGATWAYRLLWSEDRGGPRVVEVVVWPGCDPEVLDDAIEDRLKPGLPIAILRPRPSGRAKVMSRHKTIAAALAIRCHGDDIWLCDMDGDRVERLADEELATRPARHERWPAGIWSGDWRGW